MRAFEYVEPGTLTGVSQRLSESVGALPLAGGMDLIGLMKNDVAQPARVVSLKGVAGLDSIAEITGGELAGGLRIGALVTLSDLVGHAEVQARYPALTVAAESVGTPQIRNRGTLGGNLCQRPRCWYFRSDLFNCLKKGGDACFAQGGENRYHAIFGNARCAIVHPSSCAPALIAYDAVAHVAGAAGERQIALSRMFVRPESNVRVENSLRPDEVITAVQLPAGGATRSASYVVKFKQSHDWPLAIASVAMRVDGNSIEPGARVVLGAVAPVPWRSETAEAVLAGAPATWATAESAAEAAVADADPMPHNAYKVHIAAAAVKRAIMAAIDGDGASA